MLIGGLQKFSLLDYPEKISAIVFTKGCNFRCQFCYNPMLVWPASAKATAGKPTRAVAEAIVGKSRYAIRQQKVHPEIKEDDFFVFLRSRAGKLDAVAITGGEPCLQKDLPKFMAKIKKLGFLVKLDTNGGYPETLEKLTSPQPSPSKGEGIRLIDYLAMDLKAPAEKYEAVAGAGADFEKIKKSVKIIMASGLPYEFRTTVVPGLLNKDDIGQMGKIIAGAHKWYLQGFKSGVDLVNQDLKGRVPYNLRQMQEMAEIGKKYVKICEVR
ncbi:MAG: anaerobic ribonucleoside-triphosphate reductase activating protein [Parcubacteria group bacterium]|nr:anaerobic ribonucleoside-triphosphate reductase activating protein [Parcubacteria group bacterium]